MQTQRLTFAQMQQEFEALPLITLKAIKGGVRAEDPETEWGTHEGILYMRTPGGEWEYYATLAEITVTPTPPSSFNWGSLYSIGYNPFGIGGVGGVGDSGGGGGGSGNTGSNQTYTQTLIASAQAGATLLDIAGAMNTALGMAASHAQAAATVLELESRLFTTTSNFFAVFDIGLNVWEIFATEQDMAHKLEDWGQVALGIGIIFSAPIGAIIGGVVLAGWEIYEYKRDHSNS